jgi:hypothetical protein
MDETTENKYKKTNLEQSAANESKEPKEEKKEAEAGDKPNSAGLGKGTKPATEIQGEASKGSVFSMWGKIRDSVSTPKALDSNLVASADVVNEVEVRTTPAEAS